MNQSAIRALCSCVVLAVVAAQAHAGNSLSSPAQQATRELELSIRQRGAEAFKAVQQDAIKNATSKAILLAQLQASLAPQSALASAEAVVVSEQAIEPSAD